MMSSIAGNMSRTAATPNTGMSRRSGNFVSGVVLVLYGKPDVRAMPQFLSTVWALFQETKLTLLEPDVADVRKEAIMDKCCNFFDGAGYCLGKAFIITNLVEKVVTVDNNHPPTYMFPRSHQKLALKHSEVFVKRTNKV